MLGWVLWTAGTALALVAIAQLDRPVVALVLIALAVLAHFKAALLFELAHQRKQLKNIKRAAGMRFARNRNGQAPRNNPPA